MTKKEFTKLAKKHLTIDEKQNLAFGRKFKYIGGIEELYKAMNFTHCCKPKGTVKTIDFERTIDLLDAEIDSLKDAYHQETIVDRKTVYSSMILESLHAKKKLKE